MAGTKPPDSVIDEFRRRLTDAIIRADIGQADLARKSGLTPGAMTHIRRAKGKRKSLPTLWTTIRMAKALGLHSVDALLGDMPIEQLDDEA